MRNHLCDAPHFFISALLGILFKYHIKKQLQYLMKTLSLTYR